MEEYQFAVEEENGRYVQQQDTVGMFNKGIFL